MTNDVLRRACRGCRKPLIFVRDPDGNTIPLDPGAPVYRLEVDMMGATVAIRSDALVSHFSTCPKAGEFSASRKT